MPNQTAMSMEHETRKAPAIPFPGKQHKLRYANTRYTDFVAWMADTPKDSKQEATFNIRAFRATNLLVLV